jgi:TPR repeat protein
MKDAEGYNDKKGDGDFNGSGGGPVQLLPSSLHEAKAAPQPPPQRPSESKIPQGCVPHFDLKKQSWSYVRQPTAKSSAQAFSQPTAKSSAQTKTTALPPTGQQVAGKKKCVKVGAWPKEKPAPTSAMAKLQIGIALMKNPQQKEDFLKGRHISFKAAHTNIEACFLLAELFLYGSSGVQKNWSDGMMLLSQAAKGGHKGAKQLRNKLVNDKVKTQKVPS